MRFGVTPEDRTERWRDYTRKNRDTWKELGYRMMSTLVHDDDREIVLAELEVRRCFKLVELAESSNDMPTLHNIAMRNMMKRPKTKERERIKKLASNSKAEKEILHYLAQSVTYGRKHTGVENNFDKDADVATRTRMEAKGVAYANLSAAFFHLAKVSVEYAEKRSVFNVRDTPPVGD